MRAEIVLFIFMMKLMFIKQQRRLYMPPKLMDICFQASKWGKVLSWRKEEIQIMQHTGQIIHLLVIHYVIKIN